MDCQSKTCSGDKSKVKMRAEIISISNGTLAANKITMVRGDTLEITLRVLKDDGTPIPISHFEAASGGVLNSREPATVTNQRLSIEFMAPLKDGGEVRVIYRTTQSMHHVVYGSTDELTIVLDQYATKNLPAPLSLNFDMQVTAFSFGPDRQRTSTVYQGILQIDKDFTRQY
jgi:hypothetical protein